MNVDPTDHPHFRAGIWRLDPAHSELGFSLKHLMISRVRGTFDRFDVTVVTSDVPFENSVEATIDVSSINTRNPGRDEHLRSSDFFLLADYQTIEFRSTHIDLNGEEILIAGDLTMRGITAPVTLHCEVGGVVTDNSNKTKAGVTVHATLDRRTFGVSWNSALESGGLTLGSEVAISVELELVLQSTI